MTATALDPRTRPLPAALAALRDSLLAAGWTATSPLVLDPEAEQIATEEKWDLNYG
jgi:hypothetical protein